MSSRDLCEVECFNETLVSETRESLPDEKKIDELERIFSALAEKSRLRILHAFKDGNELCVCDLAHVLNSSVAAVSHHLRRMRDLGILTYRNEGKLSFYSVKDKRVSKILNVALKNID